MLLRRLGDDDYAQMLAGHHALIRSALAAHDGREIDTAGDGFFAVFSSPRACVVAVRKRSRPSRRMRGRAGSGCGCGWASIAGRRRRRPPAGWAARCTGPPGWRRSRTGGRRWGPRRRGRGAGLGPPPGAALADLGSHRLKDLGRPERIFQLHGAGLPAQFPPLRSLGSPALPNNLPAQLSAFIGRARELSEVRGVGGVLPPVTLTGAGGAARPGWGCRWPPGCSIGPGMGSGWWSWLRSPARMRWRRPSPGRWDRPPAGRQPPMRS